MAIEESMSNIWLLISVDLKITSKSVLAGEILRYLRGVKRKLKSYKINYILSAT